MPLLLLPILLPIFPLDSYLNPDEDDDDKEEVEDFEDFLTSFFDGKAEPFADEDDCRLAPAVAAETVPLLGRFPLSLPPPLLLNLGDEMSGFQ